MILATAAAAQTAGPAGGIEITMERKGSGMDLSLPQYKLTLKDDGSVVYEGIHGVSARGIRKHRIQTSAISSLANKFAEMHYFDLPRDLGACYDGSVVVTSATIGSRSNEVFNRGCRAYPRLDELEDEVDRVSNSRVWVRGRLRIWLHWPWFHSQS